MSCLSAGRASAAVEQKKARPASTEKLDLAPPRGTRDVYPEDMRVRNWLFGKWRSTAKAFGFEEYDAPRPHVWHSLPPPRREPPRAAGTLAATAHCVLWVRPLSVGSLVRLSLLSLARPPQVRLTKGETRARPQCHEGRRGVRDAAAETVRGGHAARAHTQRPEHAQDFNRPFARSSARTGPALPRVR